MLRFLQTAAKFLVFFRGIHFQDYSFIRHRQQQDPVGMAVDDVVQVQPLVSGGEQLPRKEGGVARS